VETPKPVPTSPSKTDEPKFQLQDFVNPPQEKSDGTTHLSMSRVNVLVPPEQRRRRNRRNRGPRKKKQTPECIHYNQCPAKVEIDVNKACNQSCGGHQCCHFSDCKPVVTESKKSYVGALKTNTVERPVPKKESAPKKEADVKSVAPAKISPKKDFPCIFCQKTGHARYRCPVKPKGYKSFPPKVWKEMTVEQQKAAIENNKQFFPKKVHSQAASLHNPIKGNIPMHDSQVRIFNPKAANTKCSNQEFWGTMNKLTMDGVQYFTITEHQLRPNGVYYYDETGGMRSLPSQKEWETFGDGNISICRIPAGKLIGIKSGPRVTVMAPQIGEGFEALLYGLDPVTMERFITPTSYSWSGKPTENVIHSATTANYGCGALLYDSRLGAVVGHHHGSWGPDTKHGNNNLCSPLKAMGLRQ
jgi:hypothetical protein